MSIQGKTVYARDGETLKVESQWAAQAEKAGTTVSTSDWTFNGQGVISGEGLSGTRATCLLAPTDGGVLQNTATLADGQVLIRLFDVEIVAETGI